MRIFHITGDQYSELETFPDALPPTGYVWVASARREFEVQVGVVQAALQRWTGGALFDLHVADLLNNQLPSNFDTTSLYDLLVFRRLAAGAGTERLFIDANRSTLASARAALAAIDTSPVGFAVFDRVLVTVHPNDCQVRDFFVQRLQMQAASDSRGGGRTPSSPADLMLRMVNHMVDSYLELRRLLTRQLEFLQQQLFDPRGGINVWRMLLESRNALHQLEEICEDQRAAVVEWIDALDEWPEAANADARRDRELLRVRSRDVLEHIERVLSHVRRLQNSAETAVQMHFSAQSHRTNETMRALTALTALFLPLNLVTGFFGMNFEGLPLIHSRVGFWVVFMLMFALGVGMSVLFLRKRYLGRR